MEFSAKLKNLCAEKHVSPAKLASALSITQETVNGWFDGTKMPTLEELMSIASALEASIDFLLSNEHAKLQKVLFGSPASIYAYGRVTQRGVVDLLNQDYLPHGWKVVNSQFFTSSTGEDQMFVVIEK